MPASDRSPNPRNAPSSTPLRARSTLASLSRRIPLVAPRGSHAPSGAIRALAQARQVLIFAVGETVYAAHALARRISQIDGKFQFVTYENQVRREMDHDLEGTALVLVSLSGETAQVVGLARGAAEKGVCAISLTDLHPCSLAQYARLALYCCSPARKIDDVTTTDLTPLMAALTQIESCYLQEIGVL
ncbi:MAG: SIS domain-containing protein [Atopobiaceae bacterium]|nr:SIS domain-containing protein [Atopobiaceae bacterium]